MDKFELHALLTLLHQEARAAYWHTHTGLLAQRDCGSDFEDNRCVPCNYYEQCRRQSEIDAMLEQEKTEL